MKKDWKYFLLLGICFGLLVFVEYVKPKKPDWKHSFSANDKIPYGAYVLRERLHDIFPGQEISNLNTTAYERNRDHPDDVKNYIYVNAYFKPDQEETNALLSMCEKGNNIFIAAYGFHGSFADTLGLKVEDHLFRIITEQTENDSIGVNFCNPALMKEDAPYYYKAKMASVYFSAFNAPNTAVLGTNNFGEAVFIKIPYGRGCFYLSSTPLAFTNYSLLWSGNEAYASGALSCLPLQNTMWEEYSKSGRREASTPIRYILNSEPLRWAYFITLGTLFCFIIFEAKRKQRIIPEIKPPENTTLEFAQTVGRLYFQYGNHKNIANKKILYFLDHLRNKYFMNNIAPDNEFIEKLAKKTGQDKKEIRKLIEYVLYIHSQKRTTEEQLLRLNRMIEEFMTREK